MNELTILRPTAARAQHGLLTSAQLRRGGLDPNTIKRLVRSGRLQSMRRGQYALNDLSEGSWEQRVMSVCLEPGTMVGASHLSAARAWGLWATDEVEVSVRYPAKLCVPGATVHRSRDLEPRDIIRRDGLPVTTPSRTLVDLGLSLPPDQVSRVVDHAIAKGLVSVSELWAMRSAVGKQGRNGAGILGALLREMPTAATAAESGPEVHVLRLLLAHGLPEPEAQVWVAVAGRRFRIDLAYVKGCLAIEYDGAEWHDSVDQQAADAHRQHLLEVDGWRMIRIRKADLVPPYSFIQEIRAHLQHCGVL